MLELRKIYKNYQVDNKPFPALKDINLSFAEKGFVSILGPSGCGKTTLLNLIGGLDQYTKGDLLINGKSTKQFTDRDWDAYRNKRVGFIFQNYNLVPHLTILANVELSLTLSGMSKRQRLKTAADALTKVGLKSALKKKPNQLSGGQMQRVAIARALVNNPEIILADEPTGALDTKTSIQVLDLLAKVADTRLVIMVTHNEELAKQYSTRIIKLRDGRITNDSRPIKLKPIAEDVVLEKEKNKQTHMSFFTALGNSFKNLLTKKGRTIMTAVAASFGIIGVSLVLAMSNGFSNYVANVEASTASTVPITISPFVTTSINQVETPEAWPDINVIKPFNQDLSEMVTIHRNPINKNYADYCMNLLSSPQHYASSVLENHEFLDFNIFTERNKFGSSEKEIIKVDQFRSAGAVGSILSGTTGLPSTIFHELYGDKTYINNMYDVITGTYPTDQLTLGDDGCLHGEVCLACDRYNQIPTAVLYDLGLSSTDTATKGETIEFSSLLGHEYKAYMPEPVYTAVKTDADNCIKTSSIDKNYYREFDKNNIYTLKTPTQDKTITTYLDVSAKGDNKEYLYPNDLKNLYTQDTQNKPIKLKISGIIRPKKDTLINLMPGSVCYNTSLKDHFVENIKSDSFSQQLALIAKNNFYISAAASFQPDTWSGILTAIFAASISSQTSALDTIIELGMLQCYSLLNNSSDGSVVPCSMKNFMKSNYRFSNELKLPTFTDYVEIDIPEYKGYKIPTNIDPNSIDGFEDLITSVYGYSTITSILIFPKTLSDKSRIFNYLDLYNVGKDETQQILYADLAGTLTDALGTMIDIISVVLICFSAVSLLVSCVMTGVITYTSVLERTKEIGILRAIGARKKDVGRLFEAESVIIGGIGGLIGVVFTFIVEWPISLIINNSFPEQKIGMICNLNPIHALVLVIISILLTFVAGFIPARKAAKKDPVVALRTE